LAAVVVVVVVLVAVVAVAWLPLLAAFVTNQGYTLIIPNISRSLLVCLYAIFTHEFVRKFCFCRYLLCHVQPS